MDYDSFVQDLDGWQVGAFVGGFPTISMLVCSYFFFYVQVDPKVEACFNYYTAGLIVAAVGMELFPMIHEVRGGEAFVAITLGFAAGLTLVYGVDSVVDLVLGGGGGAEDGEDKDDESSYNKSRANSLEEAGYHPPSDDEADSGSEAGSENSAEDAVLKLSTSRNSSSKWQLEAVHESTALIGLPQHRSHIREHLAEIADSVEFIRNKSALLEATGPLLGDLHDGLSSAGSTGNYGAEFGDKIQHVEQTAEVIDEEVHKLHYKLDHTRRLLEGSETFILRSQLKNSDVVSDMHQASLASDLCFSQNPASIKAPPHPILWLSEHRKKAMKTKLHKLGFLAHHLLQHIDSTGFDVEVIKEIHSHIDEVERHLLFFHEDVEKAFSKWHKKRELVTPAPGAQIPSSLVMPVLVDAMLDGFLIGITSAVNPKAGLILGLANCIEMGFLGIALSIRIAKCTGSSVLLRVASLVAPPLAMFAMAMVGGLAGAGAESHPVLLVAVVCFGIVVLLALVCNELLIEAAEGNRDEVWWVSAMTFVGCYSVVVLDLVV